jgi:hypothetical protein
MSTKNLAKTSQDSSDESRRIAGELMKAYRDQAITGPDDPEAAMLAAVIHAFEGTWVGLKRDKLALNKDSLIKGADVS